ncbi:MULTISPECIES: hypothetical protein [Microbulbifer]|uniref:Lipoprotein n=1 Tax=Microbulbifer celer TaxID=435905 RepID=A0ABW3U2K9_9GAMM|nr:MULTISPECIES: hypothetical protein [Microbulbifer]UFN56088.1 hypothetical protein LPW13_10925 [Microbulbifer celer]
MKQRWILPAAVILAAGCSNTTSMDGFWCDLTGTPTTYVQSPVPAYLAPAYPRNCFAGDTQVPTAQSCLMDDAVCYQLDTGAWCTAG